MTTKAATITGSDQWTDWLPMRGDGRQFYGIDIDGSFVATVTVQHRRANDPTLVKDIEQFTDVAARTGEAVGSFDVRIGCKAGDYASGTVEVEVNN